MDVTPITAIGSLSEARLGGLHTVTVEAAEVGPPQANGRTTTVPHRLLLKVVENAPGSTAPEDHPIVRYACRTRCGAAS
jgi:hypothetical protein